MVKENETMTLAKEIQEYFQGKIEVNKLKVLASNHAKTIESIEYVDAKLECIDGEYGFKDEFIVHFIFEVTTTDFGREKIYVDVVFAEDFRPEDETLYKEWGTYGTGFEEDSGFYHNYVVSTTSELYNELIGILREDLNYFELLEGALPSDMDIIDAIVQLEIQKVDQENQRLVIDIPGVAHINTVDTEMCELVFENGFKLPLAIKILEKQMDSWKNQQNSLHSI